MGTIIEIENNEHFFDLTEEFDKKYSTNTFLVEQTLQEMWNCYYETSNKDLIWWANSSSDYTNKILTSRIEQTFCQAERNIVYSNDEDITNGMIAKIVSMSLMQNDLENGKKFNDPICVSLYNNGENPVHPGGSRMNWAGFTHDPLEVLLTVYNKRTPPKNVKLKSYRDLKIDLSRKGFVFMIGNSLIDTQWITNTKAAFGKDIMFKQIQNAGENAQIFLNPKKANPPIKIELQSDSLLVNDKVLALRDNGIWRLVLNV